MELHQLRYFVAIAETANFTRAAERSHVSQPSLSQQIGKLESEVGHKLFHRLGRKAVLTEAGTAFLERARRILFEVENAARELSDHPSLGRRITVGAVQTVMPYLITPFIAALRGTHPNLLIDAREDFRANLVRAVVEDAFVRWQGDPVVRELASLARQGGDNEMARIELARALRENPADIASYGPLTASGGQVFARITLTGQTAGALVGRIDTITTPEQANALKGQTLAADRARLPALADDEFYHADLIGLDMFDPGGTAIGRVSPRVSATAELARRARKPGCTGSPAPASASAGGRTTLSVLEAIVSKAPPIGADGLCPAACVSGSGVLRAASTAGALMTSGYQSGQTPLYGLAAQVFRVRICRLNSLVQVLMDPGSGRA